MQCLYGLRKLGLHYELKGGTSLSKGYGIINRFSEDIDIRIDPSCADFSVYTGKNHEKPGHNRSRKDFFDWHAEKKLSIDGISEIVRDTQFDDKKYRSGGIRPHYPGHFEQLKDLRPGVLLEVGFDKITPCQPLPITSWALEHALKRNAEIINNLATDIHCYAPEYTFVEKLQTISTKFRQQQENKADPAGFMRHYYDVAQLLDQERVQAFIGTRDYEQHKQARFCTDDIRKIADDEAFILSDPIVREQFSRAYASAPNLYYHGQPPFEEIMEKIRRHIARL